MIPAVLKKFKGLTLIIFIMAIGCLLPNCTHKCSHKSPDSDNTSLPPFGLLKDNYQRSSFVISFRFDSLKIKKRIHSDDGRLGYIIYSFFGVIDKIHKGDLKKGQQINYNIWVEYDPQWESIWEYGKQILVFLNRDKKLNELYVIEVGQFEITPELSKLIKKL